MGKSLGARARGTWSFLREVVSEYGADECLSQAGALAYATVFSLAPLLVIVIVVAGLFVTPEQAFAGLQEQFSAMIGPTAAGQIATMVEQVRAHPGANLAARVLGGIGALVGATGVMVQLQGALNRAWGVQPDPSRGGLRRFLLKRLLSFAMILGIAFLLLVSLVLTALVQAIAGHAVGLLPPGMSRPALTLANSGASFVVITLLFAAIFKVMPEARIRWGDVALGSVVTSALFTLGKFLIGVYLGNSRIGTAYGAASSLAVMLVWVYFSCAVLLLGAEFTQVWTRRYGSGLHPQDGAMETPTCEGAQASSTS